jgi:hypothetical protein
MLTTPPSATRPLLVFALMLVLQARLPAPISEREMGIDPAAPAQEQLQQIEAWSRRDALDRSRVIAERSERFLAFQRTRMARVAASAERVVRVGAQTTLGHSTVESESQGRFGTLALWAFAVALLGLGVRAAFRRVRLRRAPTRAP